MFLSLNTSNYSLESAADNAYQVSFVHDENFSYLPY